MILWLLFLSLLSISTADLGCCPYTSYYWSCPTDEKCSCSSFNGSCYFTTGDNSCYIYATCACCINGDQQYNNFCKDCSCTSGPGLNYTTTMDGYCYVYQPSEEIGCCNNENSFHFNNPFENYTCKAAEGLCKIDTDYGCWIMGPCSYEGCCLMLDPSINSPTSSCDSFPGSTNITVTDSAGDTCWIYSPSIDMVGGCGCSNVTGNCTCDSSSLACNITFFDGTWGIIPPGSSALYAWYPEDWSYPVTESYYCPLNYDPPAILITILCLVVTGLLTLCYLAKRYDPEFFQTTNIFKKIYRLGTILNMFWPGVHMSITLGYLYWLLDSQTFTPVQVPSPDESDQQTPYYILVNADWYAPNNATVIIPANATTINGQDCYVSTATTPTFFPGYPGIFVFLVISLVHTFHTMFNPDNKKTNYFIYCLATAVNLFTVPWTWYAWDYCYSLLPSYTGSLGHIYTTLYSIDCACIGIIIVVWILILCFGVGINGFCVTVLIIVVMALVGFVYKIMTYLQLALRFYPKLSVILDLTFHIHFVASMCIPAFKGKLGYNRMTK